MKINEKLLVSLFEVIESVSALKVENVALRKQNERLLKIIENWETRKLQSDEQKKRLCNCDNDSNVGEEPSEV